MERRLVTKEASVRVKDIFHSMGFKIFLAVVFTMFAMMLYTAGTGSSFTAGLMGFLTVPMQKVSTVVANNASVAAQSAGESKDQLIAENKQLKEQVDQLNKKLVNYYTYQQENAQLRKFLELKTENQDFKPVAAAVIGRDPNDLFGGFTLDQGTQSGVALNDPVVTEAGVVGWISSVNAGYSKVTTILSPETKISAIDKANRDTGVVGCDEKMADAGIVALQYLSAGTKVTAGDLVVTNGIGGVYPRNLLIGTVKDVKNSANDISLYAEVTPAVDVKNVRDVLVITSFQGQGQAMEGLSSGTASSASSGGK